MLGKYLILIEKANDIFSAYSPDVPDRVATAPVCIHTGLNAIHPAFSFVGESSIMNARVRFAFFRAGYL